MRDDHGTRRKKLSRSKPSSTAHLSATSSVNRRHFDFNSRSERRATTRPERHPCGQRRTKSCYRRHITYHRTRSHGSIESHCFSLWRNRVVSVTWNKWWERLMAMSSVAEILMPLGFLISSNSARTLRSALVVDGMDGDVLHLQQRDSRRLTIRLSRSVRRTNWIRSLLFRLPGRTYR